jgi:hypothetical protein
MSLLYTAPFRFAPSSPMLQDSWMRGVMIRKQGFQFMKYCVLSRKISPAQDVLIAGGVYLKSFGVGIPASSDPSFNGH